ncbi:hypothetical protein [Actinomadura rugatobispora]|uniref:Uncharacterized protein n=1 Tax=Actinomadura rugatobispora TaxID=1994 RepID=A0ABW1A7C2_9ACTN|nr:hypothetical protein GCM10010200_048420 [Actinomadura rugatobispora]
MATHSPLGVLVAGVAVLLVAGCGGAEPRTAPDRTSTTAEPRTAADGTNLAACQDGTCEVKVTGPAKLPVDPAKFKLDTLEVKPEKGDSVSFTVRNSGAVESTSVRVCGPDDRCLDLGGGGYASGDGDSSVTSSTSWTAVEGSRITANGLFITVVSADDGSAILRMRPA